jgi:hypothetical protein
MIHHDGKRNLGAYLENTFRKSCHFSYGPVRFTVDSMRSRRFRIAREIDEEELGATDSLLYESGALECQRPYVSIEGREAEPTLALAQSGGVAYSA